MCFSVLKRLPRLLGLLLLWGLALSVSLSAQAAGPITTVEKVESRYKLSGWIEAGATFNPASPEDNQNFGHIFTDRSNELLLNQAVLTFERTLKPEAGQYDWGFKIQGLFGSDARFIQTFGVFDNTMSGIVQPDLVEAYLNLHMPFLTDGGIDLKLGLFVTPLGAEVVTAPGNFFYSHSYTFNFAMPCKHAGALATFHLTPWLDLTAGATRGMNAAWSDNNDAVSFLGGFGLKFFDDKLVILGALHIGPENALIFEGVNGVDSDEDLRPIGNLVITWKATDKLTSMTEFTYGNEIGFDSEWYSGVQYFTYALNDYVSLGLRGEIYRDDDGFSVLQVGNFDDFIKLQRGLFINIDPRTVGGGDTTYTAVTVGANLKLPGKLKDHLVVRPELRYDRALNQHRVYNDSSEDDQFTAALDVIVSF